MTAIITAVAVVASVALVCLTRLRGAAMQFAHVERTRDMNEDDALERRLSALEGDNDRRDQEIRDVRSSLSLKRLG